MLNLNKVSFYMNMHWKLNKLSPQCRNVIQLEELHQLVSSGYVCCLFRGRVGCRGVQGMIIFVIIFIFIFQGLIIAAFVQGSTNHYLRTPVYVWKIKHLLNFCNQTVTGSIPLKYCTTSCKQSRSLASRMLFSYMSKINKSPGKLLLIL